MNSDHEFLKATRDELLAACKALVACHPNELVPSKVFFAAKEAIANAEKEPADGSR